MKHFLNAKKTSDHAQEPQLIQQNRVLSRFENEYLHSISNGVSVGLRYQSWPTVCKGEGNTLYAVCSLRLIHFDPFGCVVFYKSTDAGETWSAPKVIFDTPLDTRDAGIVYLGNGKLVVTSFTADAWKYREGGPRTAWKTHHVNQEQARAKLESWDALPKEQLRRASYIITSNDYGNTWESPQKLPISCPHGPTLMNDGKTLLYFGDIHADADTFVGFSPEQFADGYYHFLESDDGAQSWEYRSRVKIPVIKDFLFDEPHAIQLSNGSFLGAIRGQSTSGQYETFRVFLTHSEDGYEWTTPVELEGTVGAPPHLTELSCGAIVLSYSSRVFPTGSRARISYDGGKTWGEEFSISVSADPTNVDLGYPSTAELEDGSLITVYYQHAKKEDTFPSILYSKWKLVPKKEN